MTRRRIGSLVFLAFGLGIAFLLSNNAPEEQHVRVVLGNGAPDVTGVTLQYLASGGDVADETSFAYARGQAPRIVAHEPKLPSGEYKLHVEVTALRTEADAAAPTSIHRSVERQVTLKGGSAQVDVSSAMVHE